MDWKLFHLSWLSAMVPIGKWFRYFVNKGGAGWPTGPLHSKGLNPMICEYRGVLYLSMAPYMAAIKSHLIRHSIRTALVLGNPLQFWELPPTMQVVKLWDTEVTRVPLWVPASPVPWSICINSCRLLWTSTTMPPS